MSDYTQITSFAPKDALTTGDPNKRIRGAQLDPEFSAIAAAILSKFDSVDIANNAEAAGLVSDAKLITPAKLAHALQNATLTLGANISVAGTATFPNVAGAVTSSHTELNILDGATVTASQLNTIGLTAHKFANTSRASTTTLADDPHLTVAVAASSAYTVEAYLKVTISGGSGGYKNGWTVPSGAVGDFHFHGIESTGTQYPYVTNEASSSNVNFGNPVSTVLISITGRLTTVNAGTFAIRWAQVTSDANATIVYAGSWLKLRKIA